MKEWLKESEESLAEAIRATEDGSVPLCNMYMLAPIIYSKRKKTNDEGLIQEMIDANDEQVKSEWEIDKKSKEQYKFHYISSYLYCFVIASKIDEFKYDEIMEFVTGEMDLFEDDYNGL
jgi:hypothetical protein